jgi:serine/threonine protein kinase
MCHTGGVSGPTSSTPDLDAPGYDALVALALSVDSRVGERSLREAMSEVRPRDGVTLARRVVERGLLGPAATREVLRHAVATAELGAPGRVGVGQRLGPYRLTALLGAGGMGAVFRGEHVETGVECAIKLLQASTPHVAERFQREGEAQARVDTHPNVLRIHSAGVVERGEPYLVMDLATGGDLADRLEREGPLPFDEAGRLVARLARGLHHAHQRGVFHRDLKPANVMFSADGEPLLVDFGLARVAWEGSLTASGAILGTPAYMAPEQADPSRGPVDARTDVFALGGLLYECLVGRAPFVAATLWETVGFILNREPTPLRELRPKTPRDLVLVCARALAKSPEDRFQTAAEMADALEGRISLEARPRGLTAALALASLAAVALALALALFLATGSAERDDPTGTLTDEVPSTQAETHPRDPEATTPTAPPSADEVARAQRLLYTDPAGALALLSRWPGPEALDPRDRAALARVADAEATRRCAALEGAEPDEIAQALAAARAHWWLLPAGAPAPAAQLNALVNCLDPYRPRSRSLRDTDLPARIAAALVVRFPREPMARQAAEHTLATLGAPPGAPAAAARYRAALAAFGEALAHLEGASDDPAERRRWLLQRCDLLRRAEVLDQVGDLLNDALAHDPDDLELRLRRGQLAWDRIAEDRAGAVAGVADLDAVLAADPGQRRARYTRARLLRTLGDRTGARADMLRFLREADPNRSGSDEMLYPYALSHLWSWTPDAERGQLRSSVERHVAHDPWRRWAAWRFRLAALSLRAGDTDAAAAEVAWLANPDHASRLPETLRARADALQEVDAHFRAGRAVAAQDLLSRLYAEVEGIWMARDDGGGATQPR